MQKVSAQKRQELIALTTRIVSLDYNDDDEFETLVARLESEVIDPKIVDYLFELYPALTLEQIVDKALAYEPIILPDRSGEV